MDNSEAYFVVIDPAASDRMAEHMEFLARVSESAANRLLDELMAGIRSLNKMPYRNPTYNRPYLPIDKYRYFVVGKRYRIIYQVIGRDVLVGDIQDCRQDNDKNLV
ncbi:MAG: type II toxin-antitoxin system RelE/ParE family toxin [Defluviitaleaceae bacterium]|nr:type II toxin-antitoxin system RelE/ParE family toxin [Defluviitaleaceae bacterium]